MAKRQLNQQQKRRIRAKQDETLSKGKEATGLIMAHFGQSVEVSIQGETLRCKLRQNIPPLVAGDRVSIHLPDDQHSPPVVVALEPRSSILERHEPYKIKIMAANATQVWVVLATRPTCNLAYIDQYFSAAEHFGLKAALILNKSDLLDNPQCDEVLQAYDLYQNLGYLTLKVSCKTHEGIEAFQKACIGEKSIIVGQSGVGKSSLVNALFGNDKALIGDISQQNEKGCHTTTTARVYTLPSGGHLIDSPGIRAFNLGPQTIEDLAQSFIEFRPYLGQCAFRNCNHQKGAHECAILEAYENKHITTQRLHHFWKLCADQK